MISNRYGVVYKITNLVNKKIYIGQTTSTIKTRWKRHLYSDGCKCIYRSIKKYGADNFSIQEIYSAFDKESLNEAEIRLIAFFESTNPKKGYNLTIGGENPPLIPTMLGKKHSKESIKKVKQTNVLNGNSYSVICESTGEEFFSVNETARRLSIRTSAVYLCCTGKRINEKGLTFSFKNHPKKQQFDLNKAKLRRVNTPKKVLEVRSNKVFDSIKEAAAHFKIHRKTASRIVRGLQKSNSGLELRFV